MAINPQVPIVDQVDSNLDHSYLGMNHNRAYKSYKVRLNGWALTATSVIVELEALRGNPVLHRRRTAQLEMR